jgi:lipid II:glycine glycyltransferase (peptidoglycan interpeptide bridge formation enzyme)
METIKSTHPLQSPRWAAFRQKWGNDVVKTKYGYINIHRIPLTQYKLGMFIRGPEPTKIMLNDLKKFAKKNNLIFIKLEPFALFNKNLEKLLKNNDCIKGKTLFTPESFWIDLTRSEEELMASFHPKTRYNIRLAERKGVKVKIDNSPKAFNKYLELTQKTVERQGFYAHTKHYHELMWQFLHPDIANLMTAVYKNKILTTWILFNYDNFLYYPYGASSVEHNDVMANNLMMWEAIKYGKKLGLKTFDLWGKEQGKGFTRFKEGYNPEVVKFIGTWDLIINKPLYQMYIILEKFRWLILKSKSRFVKPHF